MHYIIKHLNSEYLVYKEIEKYIIYRYIRTIVHTEKKTTLNIHLTCISIFIYTSIGISECSYYVQMEHMSRHQFGGNINLLETQRIHCRDPRKICNILGVPHVDQELLTLPEHLSSPPIFSGGSCCSIFIFLCSV